jgi:hypothetical protein
MEEADFFMKMAVIWLAAWAWYHIITGGSK